MIRFPVVCTKCGSLEHLAKDCELPQQFGVTLCEKEVARQRRQGNQALLAVVVFFFGAHALISSLLGVEPW